MVCTVLLCLTFRQELESLVEAHEACRCSGEVLPNPADRIGQMSPIKPTTQDQQPDYETFHGPSFVSEGLVKQELLDQQQQYQNYLSAYGDAPYLDDVSGDESDEQHGEDLMAGGVVLSEEELALIFREMASPMDQLLGVGGGGPVVVLNGDSVEDPLVSYFDMSMSDANITQLL